MLRKLSLGLVLAYAAFAPAARAQTIVFTPSTTSLSPTGGSLTFTTTISYSTTPSVLAFSTTLPSGWSFLSGANLPPVAPAAGSTGTLSFSYITTPASPASFSFNVSYPAGLSGLQPLATSTITRDTAGSSAVTTTGPTVTLVAPPSSFTWVGDVELHNGNWSSASNWSPNGVPNNSGLATYSAQVSLGTSTIAAGASFTLNKLLLLGGTINNLGLLTLTDAGSSWAGGVLTGAGQLVNAAGAQLTASGSVSHDFNQQTITNQGTFAWVGGGNLASGNGGTFVNAAGATFIDTSSTNSATPTRITNSGFGGAFTFSNAGSYVKSGAGETKIDVPFANSGSITVAAGNLHFDSTFTQSAGSLFLANGAMFQFDNGLNLAAGSLTGAGTVSGAVTNSAVISPGSPIGQLNIQGALTLLSTSQLVFDLGGTAQGTTYDFLSVSGAATLGGTLSLNLVGGFPSATANGTTFTLITAPSLTGTFTNAANGSRIFANGTTGSFIVNYTPTSLTLTGFQFAAIPEPSTWALFATGLGTLALAALRRRRS